MGEASYGSTDSFSAETSGSEPRPASPRVCIIVPVYHSQEKPNIKNIDEKYQKFHVVNVFVCFTGSVPELYDKLREVREENLRHSQLVTARYLYPTLTEAILHYHITGIRFVDLDPDSVGPVGLDPEKPLKKKKEEILNHLGKVGANNNVILLSVFTARI
jgi:hypothetical protein